MFASSCKHPISWANTSTADQAIVFYERRWLQQCLRIGLRNVRYGNLNVD